MLILRCTFYLQITKYLDKKSNLNSAISFFFFFFQRKYIFVEFYSN